MTIKMDLFPVGVGILFFAGCMASEEKPFPPREAYESAPYNQIKEALAPELTEPCIKLPDLAPGDAVAFACNWDNRIVSGTNAVPVAVEVESPSSQLDLLAVQRRWRFETTKAEFSLKLATAAEEMKTTQASVELKRHENRGSMQMAKSEEIISKGEASHAMQAEFGKVAVLKSEQSAESKTVKDSGQLALMFTQKQHVATTGGWGEIGANRMAGSLAGMLTGSSLAEIVSGVFNIVMDSGLIDVAGIYGAMEAVLLEGLFEISTEERDAFLADFLAGKGLSELLRRQENIYQRDDYKGEAGAPVLEMSFRMVKASPVHGGWALFEMAIKNTGDLPAFDLFAVNRLPMYTSFLQFDSQEDLKRGFLRGYEDEKDLLYWRVYEPLKPGDTFKSSFALKLDEWDVYQYEPPTPQQLAKQKQFEQQDAQAKKGGLSPAQQWQDDLQSGDALRVRDAAKKMYLDPQAGSVAMDTAAEVLLSTYRISHDEYHIDAMAWLCKALSASGNEKYVAILYEVETGTRSSKLRGYAANARRTY